MQTLNNFADWLKANLEPDTIKDLATHGADAGWPGLSYYSDTCALYEQFKEEIWSAVYDDAEANGMNCLRYIAGFGGADIVGMSHQFENLMVWYMAERTANEIVDALETA